MSIGSGGERHEHLLSERKHRLLGCGLCRQVAPLVGRLELLAVLDASEAFADGRLSAAELGRARQFALDVARGRVEIPVEEKFALAVALAASASPPSLRTLYKTVEPFAVALVVRYLRGALELLAENGSVPPVAGYAAILADIEPRPVTFLPAWRTDTVLGLARHVYELREFSAMPILADALQDAGCDSDDILSHCRDTSLPHVRGCWVLDLVLGQR